MKHKIEMKMTYAEFPGSVLDQIEAGSDLEVYYEDVKDADFVLVHCSMRKPL